MRSASYYELKAARDAKARPTHWLIIPDGPAWFKLVQIAGF